MFLGCPELAWRRKMASHFSYLTLRQSSTNPQNIDARFSKSLMRINEGAGVGIAIGNLQKKTGTVKITTKCRLTFWKKCEDCMPVS